MGTRGQAGGGHAYRRTGRDRATDAVRSVRSVGLTRPGPSIVGMSMTLTIRFQVSLIDSPAAGGAGDGCREWAGGANAAQNRPTDALPVTVRQRATDSATIAVKVISATRSVAMSLISVAFASIRRSRVLPAARTPAFAISVAAALGVPGGAHPAEAATPTQRERLEAPVKAVADQRLTVDTPQGNAMLPSMPTIPSTKWHPTSRVCSS